MANRLRGSRASQSTKVTKTGVGSRASRTNAAQRKTAKSKGPPVIFKTRDATEAFEAIKKDGRYLVGDVFKGHASYGVAQNASDAQAPRLPTANELALARKEYFDQVGGAKETGFVVEACDRCVQVCLWRCSCASPAPRRC